MKCGPRVRAEEFEALRHAQQLGVPVPTVSEFSSDARTIRMEYVEGELLEDVWPTLSDCEKIAYAQQLGRCISLMRSDRQEKIPIGGINGPAHDCRAYDSHTGGPFANETDFNSFVLNLYTQCPKPIRDSLMSQMRSDHSITFTHGDLTPRNIIVKDGEIRAIIDWEFAGWFPEHWEYVKFLECCTDCHDWKNYAPHVFDTSYEKELVIHQAIVRWQRP